MMDFSRKARESQQRFDAWWASASEDEKARYHRSLAYEDRLILRCAALGLLGLVLIILCWWRGCR